MTSIDPPASPATSDRTRPSQLGYRWPAEWEPHEATWVAWPHNPATWPGTHAEAIDQFVEFARHLASYETVHVLAGPAAIMPRAARYLQGVPGCRLHPIATNDAWCRDYGPIFLVHATDAPPDVPPLTAIDARFNSWGEKYPPFDLDDRAAEQILQWLGCRRYALDFVLEGGALDGNGRGCVLTTTSCLISASRNPGWQRADLERQLADWLGARKVIWLTGCDLPGDDTDGHVDQLARFVDPRTVLVAVERDASLPHYGPLRDNVDRLTGETDQDGQPLEVIELPLPQPQYLAGQRLPASYCNFYIGNGIVAVPQFGDPADAAALEILESLFPDRDVIGIRSSRLIVGLGALHCLTQQQPSAPPLASL